MFASSFFCLFVNCRGFTPKQFASRNPTPPEVETGQNRIPVSTSRGWAQYELAGTAVQHIKRADEPLYSIGHTWLSA